MGDVYNGTYADLNVWFDNHSGVGEPIGVNVLDSGVELRGRVFGGYSDSKLTLMARKKDANVVASVRGGFYVFLKIDEDLLRSKGVCFGERE
jgi:hypothetical protein